MSKQVQVRRDTGTNMGTVIPAAGELFYNTTDKRLGAGDGSTTGGIPHVNFLDHIKGTFKYASAGGSANALTLTLTRTPGSYAAGQSFRFKATATNTGSATLNVNGLGAKTLYKAKGGIIVTLSAGDIVSGNMYEALYDGTQFQVFGIEGSSVVAGLTQIATSTPGTVTSVDFSSIPSTYNELVLHWSGVSCDTNSRKFMVKPGLATVFGGTDIHKKAVTGTSTTEHNGVISFLANTNDLQNAAETTQGILIIENYASTLVFKRFWAFQVARIGGTAVYTRFEGMFANTAAITDLRMYWSTTSAETESAVNFDAGAFTLYGRV